MDEFAINPLKTALSPNREENNITWLDIDEIGRQVLWPIAKGQWIYRKPLLTNVQESAGGCRFFPVDNSGPWKRQLKVENKKWKRKDRKIGESNGLRWENDTRFQLSHIDYLILWRKCGRFFGKLKLWVLLLELKSWHWHPRGWFSDLGPKISRRLLGGPAITTHHHLRHQMRKYGRVSANSRGSIHWSRPCKTRNSWTSEKAKSIT